MVTIYDTTDSKLTISLKSIDGYYINAKVGAIRFTRPYYLITLESPSIYINEYRRSFLNDLINIDQLFIRLDNIVRCDDIPYNSVYDPEQAKLEDEYERAKKNQEEFQRQQELLLTLEIQRQAEFDRQRMLRIEAQRREARQAKRQQDSSEKKHEGSKRSRKSLPRHIRKMIRKEVRKSVSRHIRKMK